MSRIISSLLVIVSFIIFVESCSDSASNCANWVANGFCKSAYYSYSQKKSRCAMSCGFCGSTSTASGTATSGSCTDKLTTCGYWAANGFCTNSFYNSTTGATWCANTCGLCSTSTSTSSSTSTTTTEATTSA